MSVTPSGSKPRQGRRLRGVTPMLEAQALLDLRRATHREANADYKSLIAHVKAIAGDPHLHEMAEVLDRLNQRDARLGGRPSKHPTWAMLVFGMCLPIFGSASATSRNLHDEDLWRIVMNAALPHLVPGATLPTRGPSRDQWLYFSKSRAVPHLDSLVHGFTVSAARRAQEVGLLEANNGRLSAPDRTHTVGIDGKVFSSPLKTLETERVDRRTGEIRPIRQDPARFLYGEGGEEGMAYGSKFAITSTRSPIPGHRVVLGMRHIPHAGGGGEAGAFVELLIDVARCNPGITGFVADGAFRGRHIAELQSRTGVPVISPPRRRTKKSGGLIIEKYGYAGHVLPPSRARTNAFADCRGHDLIAAGGSIWERVITADGSADFVEVTRHQTKRQRNADGSFAIYARHSLTCQHTSAVHTWWEALTPIKSDKRAGFNRGEYLRVLPGHHDDYKRVYGMRADTESLNAQFEQAFHKNRLPAWGLERQTLLVLLACMSENAWARHVWHRAVARQQAPPGQAA